MKRPSTLREQIDQAGREFNSWSLKKQHSIRLEGSSQWQAVRNTTIPVMSVTLPAEMIHTLEVIGDGNLERGIKACIAAYRFVIP